MCTVEWCGKAAKGVAGWSSEKSACTEWLSLCASLPTIRLTE